MSTETQVLQKWHQCFTGHGNTRQKLKAEVKLGTLGRLLDGPSLLRQRGQGGKTTGRANEARDWTRAGPVSSLGQQDNPPSRYPSLHHHHHHPTVTRTSGANLSPGPRWTRLQQRSPSNTWQNPLWPRQSNSWPTSANPRGLSLMETLQQPPWRRRPRKKCQRSAAHAHTTNTQQTHGSIWEQSHAGLRQHKGN